MDREIKKQPIFYLLLLFCALLAGGCARESFDAFPATYARPSGWRLEKETGEETGRWYTLSAPRALLYAFLTEAPYLDAGGACIIVHSYACDMTADETEKMREEAYGRVRGQYPPYERRERVAEENELPSDENGLPSDETGLSSDENGLLPDENGLLSDKNELPSNEIGLPSDEKEVLPERETGYAFLEEFSRTNAGDTLYTVTVCHRESAKEEFAPTGAVHYFVFGDKCYFEFYAYDDAGMDDAKEAAKRMAMSLRRKAE